jgi:type I restriction enzyme R subunit
VTDRVELDDQIAKTFKATGAVTDKESKTCHAESGAHLRRLLKGNHRYVFTLIHKFQTPEMLCDRPDVIVLTGEGGVADVSGVMADINNLLDESIAADGFRISDFVGKDGKRPGAIDLSKIDFEALAKKFPKSQRKNVELEQLKAAIRAQLEKLIRLNRTRTDYSAKFEALIDSYNAGSRNIDELFKELLALSRSLTEEEDRHVRENLLEEELAVFDILTRPGPDLSPQERDEVKKVTRHLLAKLKAVLVINWHQKVQARAQVLRAIKVILDDGLPPPYTKDLYQRKVAAVFEHVYESYQGEGASVFAMPA